MIDEHTPVSPAEEPRSVATAEKAPGGPEPLARVSLVSAGIMAATALLMPIIPQSPLSPLIYYTLDLTFPTAAIFAVVTGFRALARIRHDPRLHGIPSALIGTVAGGIGAAFLICLLLRPLLFPYG